MKAVIKFFTVLIIISAGLFVTPNKASAQQVSVSLQLFYDQLSPYGHWIQHPRYGYVWVPEVDVDFTPYATSGHWVLTDDGWTWMSDYSWGWAPFHYGRWAHDKSYGWLWTPDTQWGPAWVNWRSANGYYGWSPMEPLINANKRNYNNHSDRFTFVSAGDIGRPDVRNYYVARTKNVTIIKNSTVIKNTYVDKSTHVTYNTGPRREDVQKITGKQITQVNIEDASKPGQSESNGKVQIYKPQVKSTNDKGQKPVPQKIDNAKDVKKEWKQKNAKPKAQKQAPKKNN